jgi:sulfite exporter TauE/SafE
MPHLSLFSPRLQESARLQLAGPVTVRILARWAIPTLIQIKADGTETHSCLAMWESLSASDVFAATLELCRGVVGDDGPLLTAMVVTGLVGGFIHCAGMCGPFVLAQVAGGLTNDDRPLTEWRRLRGAALVPYHLGRMTTYAGLGAAAAAVSGQLQVLPAFRWLAGALLVLAAGLFLVQAWSDRVPWLRSASGNVPWSGAVTRWTGGDALRSTIAQRYGLGVILGFLPCAMLYAALAAAAATGGAVQGAAAMAAFALGTAPSLVAVGYAGQFFGRRWRAAVRPFAAALLTVNAAFLTAMAWAYLP